MTRCLMFAFLVCALCNSQLLESQEEQPKAPIPARFQMVSPLPNLPPILLDEYDDSYGVAQEISRAHNLQGRILWIDGTANLSRVSDAEKIIALVKQIKKAGFNTIVFDVKPIAGHTLYPSEYAPKLTEWKGQQLPVDFDPLAIMAREAKANGLLLYASLNAFSEGHRDFKIGPGYDKPDWQTVLYEPQPVLKASGGAEFPIADASNKLPGDGLTLGLFTNGTKLPLQNGSLVAAQINREGRVQALFDSQFLAMSSPEVPPGGSIIAGVGNAAAFLRRNVSLGIVVSLEVVPQFVPISQRPDQQIPLMMNPNHPDVQRRILNITREVISKYDITGIIFDDRLRYGGINADFSEITRKQFEAHLGKKLNWPDDVFRFTLTAGLSRGIQIGPYYDAWLAWRARTLSEWVRKARKVLQEARPGAQLGVYAGSWYGEYSNFGSNYASPSANAGFWYLTPAYQESGMAGMLDLLITGCYYSTATIADAMAQAKPIGQNVEAAALLTNRLARDETWCYAGIMLSQFKDDPEGLKKALQAACNASQGVMVFDLSHGIDSFWAVFEQAFGAPVDSPNADMKWLRESRERRRARDASGAKDRPVPILGGTGGTGF